MLTQPMRLGDFVFMKLHNGKQIYLTFPLLQTGTILEYDNKALKLTRKQKKALKAMGDSLAGIFIDLDRGTLLLVDSTDDNAISRAQQEEAANTKDTHEHELSPFEQALKYNIQNKE